MCMSHLWIPNGLIENSKWVLGDMKPHSLERGMHMYTQCSFLFDLSILDVDSEILHGFLFWCFKSIATIIFIWIQKDFFYKNPNFSRVNIPICLLEGIMFMCTCEFVVIVF